MSNRYKGGVISATPPTTTGGESGTASGAWTLEQQMQLTAAGLWPIQPPPVYVEDVFSTYLYTGNSSTQTITNGINLSGKGGLVWIKARNDIYATQHGLTDTVRGSTKQLYTALTNAEYTTGSTNDVTSFNSNGFSLGTTNGFTSNTSGVNFVSWTFREQPKFFDIVTYTGTGTDPLTLSHNLQSVPGCIIVKCTSAATNWRVHSTALDMTLTLNTTNAGFSPDGLIKNLTSTTFQVNNSADVNSAGATYVAYLFASNAGGFGATESDNVISCGSFTTDGSGNATVSLGYEPQWILVKATATAGGNWEMYDNMRGLPAGTPSGSAPYSALLFANLTNAEQNGTMKINSTGFAYAGWVSEPFIYIAIRRGPMAVPTLGTSVFSPNQTSGTTGTPITTGFPIDWQILGINAGNVNNQRVSTRLTGVNTDGASNSQYLITSSTAAEAATGSLTRNWGNTGFQVPSLNSGEPIITWNFGRAPNFFDEVCYSTTIQGTQAINHNLGVAPELMIIKKRSSAGTSWIVYSASLGAGSTAYLWLNQNYQAGWFGAGVYWANTSPTATQFTVGGDGAVTGYSETYVAYLFATCAGVSKIGSYTGTGTTLQINCGFTGGARFVLIKRTDSTGDWYVWDSARGIVAGNDPYLLLNSTAAEVTGTDYVDTYSAGFEISSTAPAAINANGGTYIFLAIA